MIWKWGCDSVGGEGCEVFPKVSFEPTVEVREGLCCPDWRGKFIASVNPLSVPYILVNQHQINRNKETWHPLLVLKSPVSN